MRSAHPSTSLQALVLLAIACATPALADVVHLKSGGTLEGAVTREGDHLVVRQRLGSAHVHMADVAKIEETNDRWDELERLRGQLARGSADERYRFGVWTRDHGFPKEAKRAFLSVLRLDVDHSGARAALGYVQHEGRWITHEDKKRLEGLVLHRGEWLKPEEAQKREKERKERAAAARAARRQAAADEKAAKREARQAERQARALALRKHQLEVARERAVERLERANPYRDESWYGYRTGRVVLYPYGRGGTCNGYRPYTNGGFRYAQQGYGNGTRGYSYNRNGVTYRRGIGVRSSGSVQRGNTNLRWRIGY